MSVLFVLFLEPPDFFSHVPLLLCHLLDHFALLLQLNSRLFFVGLEQVQQLVEWIHPDFLHGRLGNCAFDLGLKT